MGIERLLAGYQTFKTEHWPEQRALFAQLAQGQSPGFLVIGCSDSRVDPATIFPLPPGELFVIRNVANIVPPFDQGTGLHGTGAAIEFACRQLHVRTILVLGHAQCGGIAAAIDERLTEHTDFLSDWIELIQPAFQRCQGKTGDLHALLELESVRVSMERLGEYPFVREAVERGELRIEGALFRVATGVLELLDRDTGEFTPIR
jgi:carbonic anhydrase